MTTTKMLQEASEAPVRVRAQTCQNRDTVLRIVGKLRAAPPFMVLTCARGSSDHAATYAKYLIETRLGVPVSSFAPSVASLYAAPVRMQNTLFLAISQSGRSPDLLKALQAAQRAGAYTVAVVNDETSPLAVNADDILPIGAGLEQSVAATKSCMGAMTAIFQLCAAWAEDQAMHTALEALPDVLEEARNVSWGEALGVFIPTAQALIISRGCGYAAAQEAALKLKETGNMQAEAFSAAEVRHGPMAIVEEGFPVLAAATLDVAQRGIDEVLTDFVQRGAKVFCAAPHGQFNKETGAVLLPTPAAPMSELQPLVFLQAFYPFANELAQMRGFDPDTPVRLKKVTATV